jgi:hypothetical protein
MILREWQKKIIRTAMDLAVSNVRRAAGKTGRFTFRPEPCKHPGCLSHVTHPCEECGRQWGPNGGFICFQSCPNCKTNPIWINLIDENAQECGNCGFTFEPKPYTGIYEICLLADGHQLLADTIVASDIDAAKKRYEEKYGVDLGNEQYQAALIGEVV